MEPIQQYLYTGSQEESNWRSVILFGRNVASYKFALAQALIDLAKEGKDSVTLDQLAEPYTKHLCSHVAHSPRQATNKSSKFIDACAGYVQDTVSYDALIASAVNLGFNNVLDAFHVVNQKDVPVRFFEKDFQRDNKRLILTDQVFQLTESPEIANILRETESRWNLVETAWRLGMSSSLLDVVFDETGGGIITESSANRRKSVTSARGALNGYQKGHCFYCYASINAADSYETQIEVPKLITSDKPSSIEYAVVNLGEEESDAPLCDVDHFFPHTLGRQMRDVNLDGVWNLVLACPGCNRGANGKFARIPAAEYVERLDRRNEYLISSHHPLRDTIIAQTGATTKTRRAFLKTVEKNAVYLLPGKRWSTEQIEEAAF